MTFGQLGFLCGQVLLAFLFPEVFFLSEIVDS